MRTSPVKRRKLCSITAFLPSLLHWLHHKRDCPHLILAELCGLANVPRKLARSRLDIFDFKQLRAWLRNACMHLHAFELCNVVVKVIALSSDRFRAARLRLQGLRGQTVEA